VAGFLGLSKQRKPLPLRFSSSQMSSLSNPPCASAGVSNITFQASTACSSSIEFRACKGPVLEQVVLLSSSELTQRQRITPSRIYTPDKSLPRERADLLERVRAASCTPEHSCEARVCPRFASRRIREGRGFRTKWMTLTLRPRDGFGDCCTKVQGTVKVTKADIQIQQTLKKLAICRCHMKGRFRFDRLDNVAANTIIV